MAGLVIEDPDITTEFKMIFYKIEISDIWTTPGSFDDRFFWFAIQPSTLGGVTNTPRVTTYTNYIDTNPPGDVEIRTIFDAYDTSKFTTDSSVADELSLVFTGTDPCASSCSPVYTYTGSRIISLWDTSTNTKVVDIPDEDLSFTVKFIDCT